MAQIMKDLKSIVNGIEFNNFVSAMNALMYSRSDPEETCKALQDLSLNVKMCFGIDMSFNIVDSSSEYKFFGFRFFPARRFLFQLNTKCPNMVRRVWQNHVTEWHCEIDQKTVYDISNKFTAVDVAAIFLYQIESGVFDQSLEGRAHMLFTERLLGPGSNHTVVSMLEKYPCRHILQMLTVYRVGYINFYSDIVNAHRDCILNVTYDSRIRYENAVIKIIEAYGTSELIDRNIYEFDRGAKYVIDWIFEGLNDLKYSAFRFRKNLAVQIRAMQSPYGKEIMTDIFKRFSESIGETYVEEAFLALGTKGKMTKERLAAENAHIDAYWKKQFKIVEESTNYKYLDDNGFAKKVDRQKIDELRVEIANISTVEDKIFMLERVYDLLATADNALDMLAQPRTAHKVRQTKGELERLKEDIENVRHLIIQANVGPRRYGLFVQYPAGYEG